VRPDLRQHARELHLLLLAPRKGGVRLVRTVGHADERQCRMDDLAIARRRHAAVMRVAAHHRHIGYGQREGELHVLRQHSAGSCQPERIERGERLAVVRHRPRRR